MLHRFGLFEFDDQTLELRRAGVVVRLEQQPAKALALLVARPGEIVRREELRAAIWGAETHVDFERGIAYCISKVRAALQDSGTNPRFVATMPKEGFRFVAPVEQVQATPPSSRRAVMGAGVAALAAGVGAFVFARSKVQAVRVAVSVFDNETGNPVHDRIVAGLSDLVVARLNEIAPQRLALIGNAEILRRPRNIRNLKAIGQELKTDFVLLGQLQNEQGGLRFVTHVIRTEDQAHLKARRISLPGGDLRELEKAVVAEFERAVRVHILREGA